MKVAVIRFPGANCDQDGYYTLRDEFGIQAEYVWHAERNLDGFDAVFLPGGFSYGDYLRCGAIASRSPIMEEVIRLAERGNPVIGVCNGFQVLCESGLLPGALLQNAKQKFLCQDVYLRAETQSSRWTEGINRVLRIPIAHGEGRYECDEDTLKRLEDTESIAFRYVDVNGEVAEEANINGSRSSIAGVLNLGKNVLGMMPHPERACNLALGSEDGKEILKGFALVNA